MKRILIILGCWLAMAGISHLTLRWAHSQAQAPVAQAPMPQGDAKRGATIAAEGTTAGAPACVSCHAVEGNPDGSGTFPRLFGLPRGYLIKQMSDYAQNRRTSDIMSVVAQNLSASESADVAAFYATANEPWPKFPAGDGGLVTLGERLATMGDQGKQVPACNNCHGPAGTGQPPLIPYLAGQFAPYMSQELLLWKQGVRTNDGGQQMAVLAKSLTEHDMAAVAAYYQQVRSAATAATRPPATK
jgi:cytochrome c553